MAYDGGLRSFHFGGYGQLWLFAVGLSVMMRVHSFYLPHTEGDETVYVALAREMHWNLSHYTTKDDAVVRRFPNSIYRGPLFHHPPLYPLILKLGQTTFGNATLPGLLFANATIWLLLYYTWRWVVFQQLPVAWGAVAFAGVTFCPLLLSSTTLLHHDALMGSFMACGLVAYIEALQRPTVLRAIEAGALLTIGLNLRYNALIFLPCLAALQIDNIGRNVNAKTASRQLDSKSQGSPTAPWRVFGIVAGIVGTIGLHHYYRVLATYGTLLPSHLLISDPDAADFSPFLHSVFAQTRWKTALFLVLIYPILLAFLVPSTHVPILRSLRNRTRVAAFTPIFIYLFAMEMYFSYSQVRYFATVTPCLFLGLPFLIRQQPPRYRTILGGVAALSFILMFATGFAKTQFSPPDAMAIVPAPFFYFPPLVPLLR